MHLLNTSRANLASCKLLHFVTRCTFTSYHWKWQRLHAFRTSNRCFRIDTWFPQENHSKTVTMSWKPLSFESSQIYFNFYLIASIGRMEYLRKSSLQQAHKETPSTFIALYKIALVHLNLLTSSEQMRCRYFRFNREPIKYLWTVTFTGREAIKVGPFSANHHLNDWAMNISTACAGCSTFTKLSVLIAVWPLNICSHTTKQCPYTPSAEQYDTDWTLSHQLDSCIPPACVAQWTRNSRTLPTLATFLGLASILVELQWFCTNFGFRG